MTANQGQSTATLTLPFARDHPITATFESERSEARRSINDRPDAVPLPSWSPELAAAISDRRKMLAKFGNSVLNLSDVAFSRKLVLPVPAPTTLTQVTIPLRPERIMPGMAEDEADGTVAAEWVDYHEHSDASKPAERVVLHVHGGAYVTGSPGFSHVMLWRIARDAHARVLSVDYRLSPESTFPTALFDALCAYLHLIDPPAGQPNYEPHQVSLCGESAGGALSTGLLLYCRDNGIPMPGAVATLSPWLDLSVALPGWLTNGTYDFMNNVPEVIHELTETRSFYYVKTNNDLSHPYVSPVNAVEDPAEPLPPMLIQVGDAERIRDDGIVFSECKFPNSPIRVELYEDRQHVFQDCADLDPFGDYALQRLGAFIREQTGTKIDGRPVVEHKAVRILAKSGHPEQEVPDVLGIVHDAARKLIERGEWQPGMADTSAYVLKKNAIINRPSQPSA